MLLHATQLKRPTEYLLLRTGSLNLKYQTYHVLVLKTNLHCNMLLHALFSTQIFISRFNMAASGSRTDEFYHYSDGSPTVRR